MDPFTTLGIERRFDVDLRSLEKTFRELARVTHPDRHSDGPPSHRAEALGRSVELSEAMRIVRDPIRRAEALFALAGVHVGESDEPKPTQAFLAEMLEQREALEDAKDAGDAAKVRKLAEAIAARGAACERALADAFTGARDQHDLRKHVHLLGELRFYRRFLEEVSAIEDAFAGLS